MTKLPLPSPRSSPELDEKILAYARAQLPEKKSYRPPLWLSGLATASVVAIAVIIAIPEQPQAIAPVAESAKVSALSTDAKQAPPSPSAAMEEPADMGTMVQRRARKQSAPLAATASLYAEQEMAAAEAMVVLDAVTIQQQLQEIDILIKRGDSKQAALDYQKIKELCPHCNLPATMEEAIEKYLTGD